MEIEFTTLYNKDCVNDLLCGWVESTALDDTQICVYTNKKIGCDGFQSLTITIQPAIRI